MFHILYIVYYVSWLYDLINFVADASTSSINATCTVTYNVMKQIRNKIETLIDKIKVSYITCCY